MLGDVGVPRIRELRDIEKRKVGRLQCTWYAWKDDNLQVGLTKCGRGSHNAGTTVHRLVLKITD